MNKRRFMKGLIGSVTLFSVLMGGAILISYPGIWSPFHRGVMEESFEKQGLVDATSNLVFSDVEDICGGLWSDEPYLEIAKRLRFRAFNLNEVNHYEDVRELLNLGKTLFLISVVIVLIASVLKGGHYVWHSTMISGAVLGLITGVWMLIHWHSLFKTLHWIIFLDASWKLPPGSYSLGLFPHRVWQYAGGVVGAMTAIVIVAGYLISRKKS